MSSTLIEKLHADYRRSLNDKAQELNVLWANFDQDSQLFVKFLHRLAGSSGMYGHDDISGQALKLQSAVNASKQIADIEKQYTALLNLLQKNSED